MKGNELIIENNIITTNIILSLAAGRTTPNEAQEILVEGSKDVDMKRDDTSSRGSSNSQIAVH